MKRVHKLTLIFIVGVLLLFKLIVLDQYFFPLLRIRTTCLDKHVVTVRHAGQLGNNIWEYMSLFAVTHLYEKKIKIIAYCPEILKAKVEYVFESLSILGDSQMPRYCYNKKAVYTVQMNETIEFDKLLNNTRPLVLEKWSARYKEILEYGVHNIKKELRFRKRYIEYSYRIFDKIKNTFGMSHRNVTFVGMHYRGTDYVDLLRRNYNSFRGPPSYRFYLKAMNFFNRRYKTVIFILITIDFNWLKENLPFLKENNLVINPNQQDHIKDLALLSHCNHSIINYGTFGVTAALFAGGITFAHDLGIPLDQRGPTVAMGIAKLLPNWHLL